MFEDTCLLASRRLRSPPAATAVGQGPRTRSASRWARSAIRSSSPCVKGAEAEAKKINPNVKVTAPRPTTTSTSSSPRSTISSPSGVDMILLNAVDPKAIRRRSSGRRRRASSSSRSTSRRAGADATVQTNNVTGRPDRLPVSWPTSIGDKGNVIIQNGPQVSSVIDRVKGCKEVLQRYPGHQDPVRRPGRQGLARRRHRTSCRAT